MIDTWDNGEMGEYSDRWIGGWMHVFMEQG